MDSADPVGFLIRDLIRLSNSINPHISLYGDIKVSESYVRYLKQLELVRRLFTAKNGKKALSNIVFTYKSELLFDLLKIDQFAQGLSENPQVIFHLIGVAIKQNSLRCCQLLLENESICRSFLTYHGQLTEQSQALYFRSAWLGGGKNDSLLFLVGNKEYLDQISLKKSLEFACAFLQGRNKKISYRILENLVHAEADRRELGGLTGIFSRGQRDIHEEYLSRSTKKVILKTLFLTFLNKKSIFESFCQFINPLFPNGTKAFLRGMLDEFSKTKISIDNSGNDLIGLKPTFKFSKDFVEAFSKEYLSKPKIFNLQGFLLFADLSQYFLKENERKQLNKKFAQILSFMDSESLKVIFGYIFGRSHRVDLFFTGIDTDLLFSDFYIRQIFVESLFGIDFKSDFIDKCSLQTLTLLDDILSLDIPQDLDLSNRNFRKKYFSQRANFKSFLLKHEESVANFMWILNNILLSEQSKVSLKYIFDDTFFTKYKNSFSIWFFGSFSDSLVGGQLLDQGSFEGVTNKDFDIKSDFCFGLKRYMIFELNKLIKSSVIEQRALKSLESFLENIKVLLSQCSSNKLKDAYRFKLHPLLRDLPDMVHWRDEGGRETLKKLISDIEKNLKSTQRLVVSPLVQSLLLESDNDRQIRFSPITLSHKSVGSAKLKS